MGQGFHVLFTVDPRYAEQHLVCGKGSEMCWMDGWMDRRMDGWTDGRMDGQMDGGMDRQMDGWTDGWMDGWTDGRTDGWMDRWRDGWTMEGWMDNQM